MIILSSFDFQSIISKKIKDDKAKHFVAGIDFGTFFTEAIFAENKIGKEQLSPRAIIPNDSILFAQADLDNSITHLSLLIIGQKALTLLLKSISV